MASRLPVALLAERDPYVVQQLKNALSDLVDLSVVAAAGEALAQAKALKPDIVITAVLLPDFDGYQLCRRLRDDPVLNGTPILVVSMLSSPQVALRAGADAFLEKPIDDDKLREVIARLMVQKRAA